MPIERQVEISHSQYHVDQYEGSDSLRTLNVDTESAQHGLMDKIF